MEQCLKTATRERRNRLETKIRQYNGEINKLARDLQSESLFVTKNAGGNNFNSNGNQKGGRGGYDDEYSREGHRQQILEGHQKIDDGHERLLNAHRIAVETEDIGREVLTDLSQQRKQLEDARDNLQQIDDNMTKSRKILSAMTRRIATNKMILAFIILLLLGGNVMIIYFKWIAPFVNKKNFP